jgi:hypothetical protein
MPEANMNSKPLVALFIDAENASSRYAAAYIARCRQLGRLTIARCYGGAAGLKKWEKAMAEHHILPMHTPPSATKQNASDFAMTIDAVAMLHQNMFDHAVIASSDADFTQLAIHIREYGKSISGIGEEKATHALQSAFDDFTIVPVPKVVAVKEPKEAKPRPAAVKPAAAAKPAAEKKAPAKASTRGPQPAIDTAWLTEVFAKVAQGGNAANLQSLARALAAANPDYKRGYRTLENFLKKSGLFEIKDQHVHFVGE